MVLFDDKCLDDLLQRNLRSLLTFAAVCCSTIKEDLARPQRANSTPRLISCSLLASIMPQPHRVQKRAFILKNIPKTEDDRIFLIHISKIVIRACSNRYVIILLFQNSSFRSKLSMSFLSHIFAETFFRPGYFRSKYFSGLKLSSARLLLQAP